MSSPCNPKLVNDLTISSDYKAVWDIEINSSLCVQHRVSALYHITN